MTPALASGLAVAMLLVPFGLLRARHDRVIAATLTAWLAGGLAGVAGGGTYWPHYLIEVVPVTAILAGIAIAAMPAGVRGALVGATVALAVGGAIGAIGYVSDRRPHDVERAVGSYIHANAHPGDTQYVLYARANVLFYGGVPTPFPYDWSLMVRARPGARVALYRLLASPRRPTWVVPWQDDDWWHLDRGDLVDRLLKEHYRVAATIDGHPILRRIDLRRSPPGCGVSYSSAPTAPRPGRPRAAPRASGPAACRAGTTPRRAPPGTPSPRR